MITRIISLAIGGAVSLVLLSLFHAATFQDYVTPLVIGAVAALDFSPRRELSEVV